MKDLVGSALLVSGDLRRRGGLGAPILQEESDTSKIFHLKKRLVETLSRLFTFILSDKYAYAWTWANSPSVTRGRARKATGITVFMMSSFSENKDRSHFDDTLRLKADRQRLQSQPTLTSQRQEPVLDPL